MQYGMVLVMRLPPSPYTMGGTPVAVPVRDGLLEAVGVRLFVTVRVGVPDDDGVAVRSTWRQQPIPILLWACNCKVQVQVQRKVAQFASFGTIGTF